MPLSGIRNAPGLFLWTNPLSAVWISAINGGRGCQCSSIPKLAALAPLGAIGYGFSLPGRVLFLAISILGLVKEFFEILISRKFNEFAPKMKIKAMVLLGSIGEVVSAAIGCTVIGVPLAYMFDEWIQSNRTIRENSALRSCNGGWVNPDRNRRQGVEEAIQNVFGGGVPVADPDMERALQNSMNDTGGAPPPAPTNEVAAKFILAKTELTRYFLPASIERYDLQVLSALFKIKFLQQLTTGGDIQNAALKASWGDLVDSPSFKSFNIEAAALKLKLHDFLMKALILHAEVDNVSDNEQVLIPSMKTQAIEDLSVLNETQRREIEKVISGIQKYSESWRTANRAAETGILSAVFS